MMRDLLAWMCFQDLIAAHKYIRSCGDMLEQCRRQNAKAFEAHMRKVVVHYLSGELFWSGTYPLHTCLGDLMFQPWVLHHGITRVRYADCLWQFISEDGGNDNEEVHFIAINEGWSQRR